VLWDHAQWDGTIADDKDIKRVVLCSGKVYFDLLEERDKRGAMDTYLLRLEQLYPFPTKSLITELRRFGHADVVWCQEEPKNMGAWFFVNPAIEEVMIDLRMKNTRPGYAGRSSAAAPATGLMKRHLTEQAALVDAALTYESE
jgi:2-oxoglutarate dehydrogenase E1 component